MRLVHKTKSDAWDSGNTLTQFWEYHYICELCEGTGEYNEKECPECEGIGDWYDYR